MRRRPGSGSISRTSRGWRVQVVVDGKRRSLGVYESEDEARAIASEARAELASETHHDGVTLGTWGPIVLDRRQAQGLRAVDDDRSRWHHHLERDDLAALPVRSITRADVQRFVDRLVARRAAGPRARGQFVSRSTVSNVLSLLRTILEDATARGVARENAARDVRPPKGRARTKRAWTYLTPEEQARLLDLTPPDKRTLIKFALWSGVRQGEQWALELADVHLEDEVPHVIVRFGGADHRPTKTGAIRRVDLLPEAVEAIREQLLLLRAEQRAELARATKQQRAPRHMNPRKILFPSRLREWRDEGEPSWFQRMLEAAELGRHVRWHDLRHTCASSLVSGWWGRAWSIVEVSALLGHSSTQVTERYAHLAGTITQRAVLETMHTRRTQGPDSGGAPIVDRSGKKAGSHLRDLNSRPTVYETVGLDDARSAAWRNEARACASEAIAAAAEGRPAAGRLLLRAAEMLFEACGDASPIARGRAAALVK